jgi:site-specific DNA-adenine methylase
MTKVPALLKWIGNKQRFAETITSYMPDHFNNYYEPFLGSGAVMAHMLKKASTGMYSGILIFTALQNTKSTLAYLTQMVSSRK